ncbi:hypothetical protein EON63_24615 [archaeon]|nr:MAG: hypothetical protein EON63_24615 [archaeon]
MRAITYSLSLPRTSRLGGWRGNELIIPLLMLHTHSHTHVHAQSHTHTDAPRHTSYAPPTPLCSHPNLKQHSHLYIV